LFVDEDLLDWDFASKFFISLKLFSFITEILLLLLGVSFLIFAKISFSFLSVLF